MSLFLNRYNKDTGRAFRHCRRARPWTVTNLSHKSHGPVTGLSYTETVINEDRPEYYTDTGQTGIQRKEVIIYGNEHNKK